MGKERVRLQLDGNACKGEERFVRNSQADLMTTLFWDCPSLD